MPKVETNTGRLIGYAEAGSGEAMPIVFLHGVGSDKSVWRLQLEHFGRDRRTLAFDYPGYGDSDPSPDGTSRDDYAAAILYALTKLGIAKAHICGLSLGGVVAIAMHRRAPERCASLILADTFAVHPEGQAIYDRSIAGSQHLPAMANARVDVLLGQPADPAVRSEVVDAMSRIDPAAYRIGAEAVWLADQRDRAASIRVPTLIICGSEDKVTPPALSHDLTAIIPDARYVEIAGAGHLGNIEKPSDFNRVIEDFIDG